MHRERRASRLSAARKSKCVIDTSVRFARRDAVERVFTLDFLAKRENVILVAAHGPGKTMLATNLVHQAILAGHCTRFLTASDLILDLTSQETSRAPQRRLRAYLRPSLLAVDEIFARVGLEHLGNLTRPIQES